MPDGKMPAGSRVDRRRAASDPRGAGRGRRSARGRVPIGIASERAPGRVSVPDPAMRACSSAQRETASSFASSVVPGGSHAIMASFDRSSSVSTAALASKVRAARRATPCAASGSATTLPSSLESATRAAVRSSRARASCSCRRRRVASSLISRPTPNIIAKVITKRMSETSKVQYGGTMKKS